MLHKTRISLHNTRRRRRRRLQRYGMFSPLRMNTFKNWITMMLLLLSYYGLMIDGHSFGNNVTVHKDNCVIIVLLPFTDRYNYSEQIPVTLPFSHMAATLMAMEHFNTRNPVVVSELESDEFALGGDGCNIKIVEDDHVIFDDGDFATIATRDLLVAGDWASDHGFEICAVVGPYNNDPIQGAGYISAAMNAPLVSYHADIADIGRPQQYPLTTKNTVDQYYKALVVVDYLSTYKNRNYIALLYTTQLIDTQKVMDLATSYFPDVNFTFQAIEPLLDGDQPFSVESALGKIKDSGYRTIIVAIHRIQYWDIVSDVADEYGMSGPDAGYFWMSYDTSNLEMLTQPTSSISKQKLLNGAGMIMTLDNFAYQKDDRFLQSWRSYGNDSSFVERLNEINPINKTEPGYYYAEDDYFLTHDPEPYSGFIYDSLIALGMARCRSTNYEDGYHLKNRGKRRKLEVGTYPDTLVKNEFFNNLVLNTSFSGASGHVVLNSGYDHYFDRNYTTMAYGMYNIRLTNQTTGHNCTNNITDNISNSTNGTMFENVLTDLWVDPKNWSNFSCEEFIFADGTTNAPKVSSPQGSEDNDGAILTLSILVGVFIVAIVFIVLYLQKKKQVDSVWIVKSSDLKFDNPPEVIGRGTFGVVVLAEYRGTQVAVKRVIPPRVVKDGHVAASLAQWSKGKFGHGTMLPVDTTGTEDMIKTDLEYPDNDGQQDIDEEKGTVESTDGMKSGNGAKSWVHTQNGKLSSPSSTSSYSPGFSRKVLNRTEYERLKADFIVEMRQLSKLRHPCITTVMGAVIGKNEEPMLIMEYMEHGSLYDLLHNDTLVLDGDLLLPILCDIALGVRFLHAHNPQVIHGDLKAQNILVDSKFRAKVADFGLTQKRRVGVCGTPYWMAPELLRKETDNNAETDVYAFGIILYEVYSRKEPYEGEDCDDVLRMVADPIIKKRPPIPPSCPPLVQSLMTECLLEEPEGRPTFEELDVRLKRLDVETLDPTNDTDLSLQSRKQEKRDAKRMQALLSDVFPPRIAQALREGRKVEPEHRDMVTIFFSDIVGFTNISSTLEPIKISDMLDRLYSKFDKLSHKHDVFKVETIGDAYMAVTNLVKDQEEDHAKRVADFSIEALQAANETLIDLDDPSKGFVSIRVGFHCGPVVANVVGSRNPRYCLFGDTVNTASRMESNSQKNRIQCSPRAARVLNEQYPELRMKPRGSVEIKGKGRMNTFWINEGQSVMAYDLRRSDNRIQEELPVTNTRRKSGI